MKKHEILGSFDNIITDETFFPPSWALEGQECKLNMFTETMIVANIL